ncbi:MAG: BCCT family transporter [Bacteroidota bacterium]
MTQTQPLLKINAKVFYPTILFLVVVIVYSLRDNEGFLTLANATNQWILQQVGPLFTWSAFLFLVILAMIYFSPLAKVKIGGPKAEPLLSKWRWFAIALCTTVATGILFWGAAEPLYHLHQPPSGLGITGQSWEATQFAMSTMYMHWSFTPYGIYTITGMAFALVYYNLRQPFSISALFYPLFGKRAYGAVGTLMDILCLAALVSGMAASLGTGIFALMGGLETTLHFQQSDLLMGIIGAVIVLSFILSAISGLKRGISWLSNINAQAFLVLAVLVFVLGPTLSVLKIGGAGFVDYGLHFLSRSTNIGAQINTDWLNSWTIFYFANWFAWAPVAALFLGRLALGYTVRDFIHFNLFFPAFFTCIWMMVFSGTAIDFDLTTKGQLFQVLNEQGEENVMFTILESLPMGKIISLLTLVMVFISYVTAADSNISAMSAISTSGISPDHPEAPMWIKITWGSLIGLIAWVMITSAGIDGIRLLCVIGGFPALFMIILVSIGVLKMGFQQKTDAD